MPKKRKKDIIFEVNNPKLGKITYHEQTRRNHRILHPEVDDPQFTKQVKEICLSHTDFLRSITVPFGTVVIYKYIGEVDNPLNAKYKKNYIKVVIGMRKPRRVLSAYIGDKKKEVEFWRKVKFKRT